MRSVRVKAFAKINLTLRVLAPRPDGYHSLRTVFQSLALHDSLTFVAAPGAFRIECDDPAFPSDRTNLIWRAAERLWRNARRTGVPRGVIVRVVKRIPMQAGLGGGSSNAAAAITALEKLWGIELTRERRHDLAAGLGADVPFFLQGGTVLGLERGDLLFPLADCPATPVALVLPSFGVSTKEAFGWFDGLEAGAARAGIRTAARRSRRRPSEMGLPPGELGNDLHGAVSSRHPEIARFVAELTRQGAWYAAMSGSGSAVFGLFESRPQAEAAVRAAGARLRGRAAVLLTTTLGHAGYRSGSRAAIGIERVP